VSLTPEQIKELRRLHDAANASKGPLEAGLKITQEACELFAAIGRSCPEILDAAEEHVRRTSRLGERLACGHLPGDHDPFGCDNHAYLELLDQRNTLRAALRKRRQEYPHTDACAGSPKDDFTRCDCDARLDLDGHATDTLHYGLRTGRL